MTARAGASHGDASRIPLPHGAHLVLGARALVMGIVNVTPDSFSDGGRYGDPDHALDFARRLIDDGADLLDIGGESTRPGAAEVPADEQIRRVVPVLRGLAQSHPGVPLSVDTRSAAMARAAVDAGAHIVNDVSGLTHDPAMVETVAASGAAAVVMHMRGTPADMRERTDYGDVVSEVMDELRARLDAARAGGIACVIADPGIGFAKTAAQSAALLGATARFHELGAPVLIGPSRKSFLALATGARDGDPATTRRDATVAAVTIAALAGADIVRVHDVRPCADAVRLVAATRAAGDAGPGDASVTTSSPAAGRAPEGWTSARRPARMTPPAGSRRRVT